MTGGGGCRSSGSEAVFDAGADFDFAGVVRTFFAFDLAVEAGGFVQFPVEADAIVIAGSHDVVFGEAVVVEGDGLVAVEFMVDAGLEVVLAFASAFEDDVASGDDAESCGEAVGVILPDGHAVAHGEVVALDVVPA